MTASESSDTDALWATDAAEFVRVISGTASAIVQRYLDREAAETLTSLQDAIGRTDESLAIIEAIEVANACRLAVDAAARTIEEIHPGSSFHAQFANRLRARADETRLLVMLALGYANDEATRSETMRRLVRLFGRDHAAAGDRLSQDLVLARLRDADNEPTQETRE